MKTPRIGHIFIAIVLTLLSAIILPGCFRTSADNGQAHNNTTLSATEQAIDPDGSYTDKDNVALFIHTFNRLPKNYITKKEAEALGWVSQQGNLHKVAPGKSIGGDKFRNFEGLLPKKAGRQYYECDIDYESGRRNAKRIVFSDDGLIFYTKDHYNSFEKLY